MTPRATRRFPLAATALLALGLLLSATASAQTQPFSVDLSASQPSGTVEPEGETTLRVTVRNTGASPVPPGGHDIRLNVSHDPAAGWRVSASPGRMALAPGASQDVTLTVTSETTDRSATVVISVVAEVYDPLGQVRATDMVVLTVVQSGTFLTPVTQFLGDKAIWVVVGGIGVLVVVLVAATSKKRGGVALRCDAPHGRAAPGETATYALVVENRGRDDDVLSLSTTTAPPGWETFLSKGEATLESGDEETVHLTVRAAPKAAAGSRATVRVVAASGLTPRVTASVDTVTEVDGEGAADEPPPDDEGPEASVRAAEPPDAEETAKPRPRGRRKGTRNAATGAPAPPGPAGETRVVRRREAFVDEPAPASEDDAVGVAPPAAVRMDAAAVTLAASRVIVVGDAPAPVNAPFPDAAPLRAVKRPKGAAA